MLINPQTFSLFEQKCSNEPIPYYRLVCYIFSSTRRYFPSEKFCLKFPLISHHANCFCLLAFYEGQTKKNIVWCPVRTGKLIDCYVPSDFLAQQKVMRKFGKVYPHLLRDSGRLASLSVPYWRGLLTLCKVHLSELGNCFHRQRTFHITSGLEQAPYDAHTLYSITIRSQ